MHSTSLLRLYSAFLLIIFCAACGSIKVQSAQTGDASESPAAIDSGVFVFATDYESSGQLYFASVTDGETNLYNSGVTLLGSSAIVRSFNDMIYVLHDGFSTGSNNNLQIIDPNDDYKTVLQQSTGDGTNPHDVLVNGESAFISLYNPGENGDVIEMNTSTGEINRFE